MPKPLVRGFVCMRLIGEYCLVGTGSGTAASCYSSADGTAESEENDDVTDQGAEGEGDAGEAPELQVCHSCRGESSRVITLSENPTSVKLWRVSDGGGEDPDLTEKHRHQQGRPGGVAGRGDEEGDPGGEGEHGGRDEVDVDILTGATDKMDLQPSCREVIIRAPGLH